MITFNFEILAKHNITKGKLSRLLRLDRKYGSGFWDTALPQDWLNYFFEKHKEKLTYHQILGTSFTVYPKNEKATIISGCKEVQELLNKEL